MNDDIIARHAKLLLHHQAKSGRVVRELEFAQELRYSQEQINYLKVSN